MDVEGIEPGTDFVDAIEKAVTSCKVLIVLIGKRWVDLTDEQGRRRLDDPNDFIRIETSTALRRKIRVVPVLLEGTPMPRAEEVPDELVGLCRRQAITVSHKQWEVTTGELINALSRILDTDAPREQRPKTPGKPSREPDSGQVREPNDSATGRGSIAGWLGGLAIIATLAVFAYLWFPAPGPLKPEKVDDPILQQKQPPPALMGKDPPNAEGQRERVSDESRAEAPGPDSHPPELTQQDTLQQETSHPEPADQEAVEIVDPQSEASQSQQSTPEMEPGPSEVVTQPRQSVQAATVKPGEDAGETSPQPMGNEKSTAPAKRREPPSILRFTSRATQTGLSLCYEVRSAERVNIQPHPGRVNDPQKDCVEINPTEQTLYVLEARGGGQAVSRRLRVVPPARRSADAVRSDGLSATQDAPTTRLPLRGDRWSYRLRSKWPSIPERSVAIQIASDSGNTLLESLTKTVTRPTPSKRQRQRRIAGPAIQISDDPFIGPEFSPYLGSFTELKRGMKWRDIETVHSDTEWGGWRSGGAIEKHEQVTVPAGQFKALLVELQSTRTASGSTIERDREPVRVYYQIWFAPEIKRYVKMIRKTVAASGQVIDRELVELLSFRQGGAGDPK